MRINLEINQYHTATQLIFYENDVSLLQAFDNTTCDRPSGNKQYKKKNKIDCVILMVGDVDQFDRVTLKREKKIF